MLAKLSFLSQAKLMGAWFLLALQPPKSAPDKNPATPTAPPKNPTPVASSVTAPKPSNPPRGKESFTPQPVAAAQAKVLISTLPCGLRVIVAQDQALPVAAVVLSIPSGHGDDPSRNPGLIHALAYALQMGNRELSPGAALDEVYDSGGFAEMAVGAGQTRFEALIPQWSLRGVLRVEADRFSTPTLSKPLWIKALQFAAQDRRPPHGPHIPLRGVAFDQPNLLHDGRTVLPGLAQTPLPALSRYLSQHFRYDRATLAVVSAQAPGQTLKTITKVFSKLPATPRSGAKVPPSIATLPRPGHSTDNKGWFLRALPADPKSQQLGRILCERLRRGVAATQTSPILPGLDCSFHPSPTHPFLQLAFTGTAAQGLELKARLAHLASGQEDDELSITATRIQAAHRAELSSALTLARHLASLPEWSIGPQTQGLALDTLQGAFEVRGEQVRAALQRADLLSPNSYRVVEPSTPKK